MARFNALTEGRRRTHERAARVHAQAARLHRMSAARFASLNYTTESAAELRSAVEEDRRAAIERERAATIGR